MNKFIKRALMLILALVCVAGVAYAGIQLYQYFTLRNDAVEAKNMQTMLEENRAQSEQDRKQKEIRETELVKIIKKATLAHYGVGEFPEILYDNQDDLLGQLIDIRPTNPGSYDGEYSLDFVGQNNMGTWTGDQALAAATTVMRAAGAVAGDLKGITANLAVSTWQGDTVVGTKIYADQHVGREVLAGG